jgi:hypothetical protein
MISKGTEPHCTIIAKGRFGLRIGRQGEDERMPRNDEMDATFDIVNWANVIMLNYALEKVRWPVSIAI